MAIFTPKMQELGRIRIGEQVPAGKGTRPARLETFRLTSPNKPLIHYAAKMFGGEVREWEGAPVGKQWEVITSSSCLPVTVPPFNTISQFYEIWSGGGCEFRCDGDTITHHKDASQIGQSCLCTDSEMGTACQALPVTRLSLMLHDIPGFGTWRLDTRGWYAGSELLGIVPFVEKAASNGLFLKCMLSLETRQVKRQGKTRIFPTVTLQPMDVTIQQLLSQQIPESSLVAPRQGPPQITQGQFEATVSDIWGDREEPTYNSVTGEVLEDEPDDIPMGEVPETIDLAELKHGIGLAFEEFGKSKEDQAKFIKACGGGDTTFSELTDIGVLKKMNEIIQKKREEKPNQSVHQETSATQEEE